MNLSNRRVHVPLSQGRGYEVGFFSVLMGKLSFQSYFCLKGIGFSPLGRRERGFPVLHYNPVMPIKNIIPGQTVTKEKLQRDPSVLRTSPHFPKTKMGRKRRDMTPAEKILWLELRGNKLGVHFSPLRLRHLPQIRRCKC